MRHSRFRNLPRFASSLPAAALVTTLGFALAGCTGKTKGQVILALQTDMSMPDDVTKVKIKVTANGAARYDNTFVVDPDSPGAEKIPATLAIVAGEQESETIELTVVALRPIAGNPDGDLEPRTLNKTITTIPKERIAMLHVPMQWLCTGTVTDLGDGDYESNCDSANGKETSCVAGGCKDVHVNSSNLPDFAPDAVFGGADQPGSGGTCFPTEACFDAGETVVPDANCIVTFEPESDKILNFAVLAAHGGICRGPLCYVALDQNRDFGWYELAEGEGPSGAGGAPSGAGGEGGGTGTPTTGRRFQLPQAVCDRIQLPSDDKKKAYGVRVSTSDECLITKTLKYPTCGPWSGVGKVVEPPPAPPTDADGDGVDTTDVGGTDCDDKDDTVYPGATEICDDGIDNNCDGVVDTCSDDADGDGVLGIDAGGTDCDDNDPSVYPGAPEACDQKDNDCDSVVDDSCVMDLPFSHHVDFSALDGFTSTQDYAIYQNFDAQTPLDLDQKTVTFTPNAAHTRYTVTAGDLAWVSNIGALVPQLSGQGDVSDCDDCYSSIPIGFPFNFYGTEYATAFPSSNGYLTFVRGDATYNETVEYFLAGYPRIAALFDDLDTRGGSSTPPITDEVHYTSTSSRLIVTYQNIQHYPGSGTQDTFQFVLHSSGVIEISFNGMENVTESSLMGITPGSLSGGVTCTDPLTACYGSCVDTDTDPMNCGACGNVCASGLCSGGTCAGNFHCLVSNTPCAGTCIGTCEYATAKTCDETCSGTCTGTCTPDNGTNCGGICSGRCLGTCGMNMGGTCADPDACTGSCYADTVAECGDVTTTATAPCDFPAGTVSSASYCTDYAQAGTTNYTLSCSGAQCQCCQSDENGSSVCFVTTSTSATACVGTDALRTALLDECMQGSVCGAGCPTSAPTTGDSCDETEIGTCNYPADAVNCTCMGGMFLCN